MKIAILIPTKNRVEFLKGLLHQFIKNDIKNENINIYVVDASNDTDTLSLVSSLKNNLNIHCIKCRGNSIDEDIFNALDVINEKYVWLLGDDDGIYPYSVNEILQEVDKNSQAAGFTFNYQAYDSNLEKKFFTHSASKNKIDHTLKSTSSLIESCGAHLGFISCQIINNHLWKKVNRRSYFSKKYNAWSVPFIVLNILKYGNENWIYCNTKVIKYRTGNDSFLKNGIYNRQKIMFEGFFLLMKNYSSLQSYLNFKKRYFWTRLIRNVVALKLKEISFRDQLNIF